VEWSGDFLHGEGRIVSTTTGALPELGVTWNSRIDEDQTLTSPEELIAAAHASCYAMAFTHDLVAAGGKPERLHVSASVSFDPALGITGSALEVAVEVAELSSEQIQEIAEGAKDGCPVSRALAGIAITLRLVDSAPAPAS
jgi:osmotically inducible protein OsmC